MGEQRGLTLAVTGAGGARMARFGERHDQVAAYHPEGLTARMVSGGCPTYGDVPRTVEEMFAEFTARLMGFIGLGQADRHAWTGAETSAHRDRGR